ncbi:MAG TPA: hypothetical protein VN777_03450 [Terriglobales bacterium]|nr:hypothetical protein [Terriglobales bacterium]
MKSDHFLRAVLFVVLLTQLGAHAQTQGADGSADDANKSWTSTTQQQLPGNLNPIRTSETHTESAGRVVDKQSVEHMGVDGRYEPYLDVQKETVKVNANTVRTVERKFARDPDGRQTLVQVTEEEKRSLPGGEVKVVRTTSNPDGNGALQIAQREEQDTRQINPNVQETKSTLLTPSPNGGLTASMQTTDRETKTGEHNVEFRKSTLLPDSNGNWQLSEVREGTIKDDGKDRTKDERVLRTGTDGNLSLVERTVSKESQNAAGDKRNTVETYSTDLPGTPIDGTLRLNQRVTTIQRKDGNGAQSTEKQVEQRNPAQPSDSPRVTEQAIDIVRPGLGGVTRETQTLRSLDSNGSLGVVSVDTRKQNSTPAVQVDIAPAKTTQPAPAH